MVIQLDLFLQPLEEERGILVLRLHSPLIMKEQTYEWMSPTSSMLGSMELEYKTGLLY